MKSATAPNDATSPRPSSLCARVSGPRSLAWQVTDRASELEKQGADILHLGIGDPDFDTPVEIVERAITSLKEGRTHYAPISGETNLRQQIATNASALYEKDIAAQQVVIFPGAQSALFATLLCVAEHGDEVILLEPAYATYDAVAQAGGARAVHVPLDPETGFALDIARIEQAINSRTRAIILNSPSNPSGTIISRSAINELVSVCRTKGIWIVSDEVYGSMVFEGEHISAFGAANSESHVVVVNSLSKSHAMTGWRLGWTIAPASMARHLSNLAQPLLFGVCQFTQDAAAFALAHELHSVAQMRDTFRRRRDVFCERLAAISSLKVYKPAGGMFLLVDVADLGMDGDRFANELLDETGVAVVPGFAFGDSVRNCVRIGFLRDEEVLIDAADRIKRFVESKLEGEGTARI